MKSSNKQPLMRPKDKLPCLSSITGKYLRALVNQGLSGEVVDGWWHDAGIRAPDTDTDEMSIKEVNPVWN